MSKTSGSKKIAITVKFGGLEHKIIERSKNGFRR